MNQQQRKRIVAGINASVGFYDDDQFGSDFLDQFPVADPMPSPRQIYDWLATNDDYYYNVDTEEVKSLTGYLHTVNKATTIVGQLLDALDDSAICDSCGQASTDTEDVPMPFLEQETLCRDCLGE